MNSSTIPQIHDLKNFYQRFYKIAGGRLIKNSELRIKNLWTVVLMTAVHFCVRIFNNICHTAILCCNFFEITYKKSLIYCSKYDKIQIKKNYIL
jgi:hypothetical protein